MKKKTIIRAVIERAADGRYSIYMDDDTLLWSCMGDGDTEAEARADFMEGYAEMRSHFESQGKPFEEVEFRFVTDYVSMLQYLSSVFTLVGLSRLTGINKGQLSHYITGTSRPKPRTIERIRTGLRDFAHSLEAQVG